MTRSLACAVFVLVSLQSAQAETALAIDTTEALTQCLAHWAAEFEPLQDNMLDLAELVFSATCHTERDAMLAAAGALEASDAMTVYRNNWLHSVQAMVVGARAQRLGIELTVAP